ncbi:hypothetical protein B0O80DRAFT_451611 [Mortierella sp. GBAus27b]|nr:hypothetical protein BGX31_001544 [Mortierella sp. GBA43]KAI8353831.1 hypothetical protein B0O80DRAFT_451611 [Mortierella sp. GBAus27b]
MANIFTHVPLILMNDGDKTSSTGCIDRSKSNATTTTAAQPLSSFADASSTNNYWDVILDEQIASDLDLTPELSPSMSLCSPAIDLINSPFSYDSLGLNDFGPSPVDTLYESFGSPFDETSPFETPSASFDFDFNFCHPEVAAIGDFELFPSTTPESAKLRKILLESSPVKPLENSAIETVNLADMSASQESVLAQTPQFVDFISTLLKPHPENPLFHEPSPFLDTIDTPVTPLIDDFDAGSDSEDGASDETEFISSGSFAAAKSLGQDIIAPDARVAPRKTEQSPTKPGFQPAKRPRRRRITSEEASRVVPDNDPQGIARYKCSECSKTFSRPFNLKSHRAIHRGLKPHACTYTNETGVACHWSFARRHDLERHVRSRHNKDTTA